MDGENYISVHDFSLKHTVESAQPLTFYGEIEEGGNAVSFVSGRAKIFVSQKGSRLYYHGIGAEDRAIKEKIYRSLGLGHNLKKIYRRINTDQFMSRAIESYRGMRVTLNDPWETTLSFLVSQFNNVKRIRGIMRCLISRFGEVVRLESSVASVSFNAFPSPDALAKASLQDLMRCGAGFRARYIKEVAAELSGRFDLGAVSSMGYNEGKERLMELKGIGDKVADCILLMGYGKLEAFPIDTWVKRIIEHVYFGGERRSIKQIHEFAEQRWGVYAGYAQQYLFWYGRSAGIGKVRRIKKIDN